MQMPADVPSLYFFIVSALVFAIGAIGVLLRRNAIIIFMCIEMMLSAVNVTLVTASHYLQSLDGVLVVFFVMTVAAAEAAVGLAIFVVLFRNRKTIKADEINLLKG
jgi:NADH-quinone oxidoreductase subunit K